MTAPAWTESVDVERLAGWMDGRGLGGGPIEHAEPIGGGSQNVMLRFVRDGRTYVLRRGPHHLRKHTNDQIRRELQVLGALSDTDIPHPRLIAACTDTEVLDGAVFYLMEPVDGFNAATELPGPAGTDAAHRHAMGLDMARSLGRLARVDPQAIGLGDVGRPDGFLERQVPRWLKELRSFDELDGYEGFVVEEVGDVAEWLDRHRPQSGPVGMMHGDFHIANVMFAVDEPRVAAIVDWEMCTVGDPLADLGWFLASWPDKGTAVDLIGGNLGEAGGLPTTGELLDVYADVSGRDVTHAEWYQVLACFKLGIVLEGTHARACAGKAPVEMGDRLHAFSLALFAQALELMG